MRLGLSEFESNILSSFAAEGKSIFSMKELEEKIGSNVKARKMASSLCKKKWLERLNRGIYLILELAAGNKPVWAEDSYYIASKLTAPYYIGYFAALNYYGWTEQIPTTITVATTKITRNKKIMGVNYEFVALAKKKFFGFTGAIVRGRSVTISDREKTLVDALDHPKYCGGIDEVAKAVAKREVNWPKVIEYADKMGNGAIFKRLGFLLEAVNSPISPSIIEKIRTKITKGYSPLSPGINSKGKYNSRWNILVNTGFSKEKVLA